MIRLCSIILLTGCLSVDVFSQSLTPEPIEGQKGAYRLGGVKLNTVERTLEIPCRLNMTNSVVEYVLVEGKGKGHESILVTDVKPLTVHLGMLFLGAKPAEVPDPRTIDFSLTLKGEPIQVEYREGGKGKWKPVSALIGKDGSQDPVAMSRWNYNGSWTFNEIFIAERDGSIVSIIADRDALANNQHKDRENDDLWTPRVPSDWKIGREVDVRFRFTSPKKSSNKNQLDNAQNSL